MTAAGNSGDGSVLDRLPTPEPPPDAVDVKADAHRVAVEAFADVARALTGSLQRLRMFEALHREDFGSGTTLTPVRAAINALRPITLTLGPLLRRAQQQAERYEQSNFEEVDEPDISGR